MSAGADLRADCSRCFALCCVAPAFAASADFAFDKPAGSPCRHLASDDRCAVHAELRPRGMTGCTVYDCFGAGQHLSQVTFAGRHWRDHPESAPQMFALLPVVRQLHELLWCLAEAGALVHTEATLREDVSRLQQAVRGLTALAPEALRDVDLPPLRHEVGTLLAEVSRRAREPEHGPSRRGADLVGRDLRTARLRGADLRGSLLIGADLRGADLTLADLLGADLRGADLRGADLRHALFLTDSQLTAARGDAGTAVPAGRVTPSHWV